LGIMKD